MQEDSRSLVRKIPLFKEFSDQDCDAVLSVMRVRHFQTGDVVFREGTLGDTMIIVLDGRLRVEMVDANGTRAELGAIQQGEVVGEMAALDPAPRAATVVAASDAVVYELGRSGLQHLRVTAPAASAAVVSAIIGDVTRRLRNINVRIDRELNPSAQPLSPRTRPISAVSEEKSGSVFSRIWSRLTGD